MLLALLADLRELAEHPGGFAVAAVVRPELASALPPGVDALPGGDDPATALARVLAEGGGRAWPVAPETRGTLARLVRAAERAGEGVVGTTSRGVRRAARRRALLRRLERAGVPVPDTLPAPTDGEARRAMETLGSPVVVKPGRGAGGAGVRKSADPAEVADAWAAAASVEPGLPPLVQPFEPGTPASVTLIVDGERVRPLALNRQIVRFSPEARYEGGVTPLRHPDATRALRTAADAVRACGGLRGLVGVDLVLGSRGPVVLEVNPRLTTSYLGLRRHLGPGPAHAALRASGHRPAGDPPAFDALDPSAPVTGDPVRFGPGGRPPDRRPDRAPGAAAPRASGTGAARPGTP
jgi:predicted ATP-grasp superfamily ATP-dependent carboligase